MVSSHFVESSLADKLAKTDESASRNHSTPSTYTASITTKLPPQPNPNPNNRPVQSVQIIETPELETDLRECNDLQLRSRCIIETEGDKNVQVENQLPAEQILKEEEVFRKQTHDQATTSSTPFPERLIIPHPIEHPDFDIMGGNKEFVHKNLAPPSYPRYPNICKDHQRVVYKENQGGE